MKAFTSSRVGYSIFSRYLTGKCCFIFSQYSPNPSRLKRGRNKINTGVVGFEFETPTSLSASVKYAIVARLVGEIGSNHIDSIFGSWPLYAEGDLLTSSNSGTSWTAYTDYDRNFREYGETETEEAVPGLLHVRHPALLTVVHKRGDLTINGYDTLSSLDKEYLTGQVGLDVEAGDSIEATTLPGIEYRRKVA